MDRARIEFIGKQVLDALFEVHRELGPGLLEQAYELALCHELVLRQLSFERQKPVPIRYKDVTLDCGFRIDVVVEDAVVLELKSVEALLPLHDAQSINYLPVSGKHLGFLVNFNVPRLKEGIRRRVTKLEADPRRAADFTL